MTFYTASFETVTLRLLLMMTVVIASFTSGFPAIGILALPIFISAMMAISFKDNTAKSKAEMKVTKSEITRIDKQAA